MKAYIQDLCGDEDHVVVDCAILQCMLQDAIFERVVGKPTTSETLKELNDCIYDAIQPHLSKKVEMDALYDQLKRNVKEKKLEEL